MVINTATVRVMSTFKGQEIKVFQLRTFPKKSDDIQLANTGDCVRAEKVSSDEERRFFFLVPFGSLAHLGAHRCHTGVTQV